MALQRMRAPMQGSHVVSLSDEQMMTELGEKGRERVKEQELNCTMTQTIAMKTILRNNRIERFSHYVFLVFGFEWKENSEQWNYSECDN